jgi:hypothetical protein
MSIVNTNMSTPLAAATYNGFSYALEGTLGGYGYGAATVTINDVKKGVFSGKLRQVGGQFSFSGSFNTHTGHAVVTPHRADTDDYVIELQVDTSDNLPRITGTVSNCSLGWFFGLELERAAARTTFSGQLANTRLYTLALPPDTTNAAAQPGGWSTFRGSLTKAGNLTLAGTLGDGTKVSQATTLSTKARFPLFILPYSSRGRLTGWLDFTLTNATPGGEVLWVRPANARQVYYPSGFVVTNTLVGEIYTNPPARANALTLTNGVCILENGNLSVALSNSFTLSKNRAVFDRSDNTNKLALAVNRANGTVSGSFKLNSRKTVSISGVVLPQRHEALGVFLGTSQAGSLTVR